MKKCLIVVDMQNDFITGSLGTKEAEGIVGGVTHLIKEWEGDIIVTQDTHGEDYLTTAEGHHLPIVHCIKCTDGWELESGIKRALSLKKENGTNVAIFAKSTFGSFNVAYLARQYEQIYIVGLCTDICVISNAILAKNVSPDTEVIVDASLCAGTTKVLHDKSLDVMRSCQICVINR